MEDTSVDMKDTQKGTQGWGSNLAWGPGTEVANFREDISVDWIAVVNVKAITETKINHTHTTIPYQNSRQNTRYFLNYLNHIPQVRQPASQSFSVKNFFQCYDFTKTSTFLLQIV